MTEEHDKIKEALEHAKGNVTHAAILCKWSSKKMKQRLDLYPDLKRYALGLPPSEVEVLDRNVAPNEQTAVLLAEKVEADSKQTFEQDLGDTGLNPAEVQYAVTLSRLTRDNFRSTLEIMHGGMARNFIDCQLERSDVLALLKTCLAKLRDETFYPVGSPARVIVLEEAKAWAKMLRDIDATVVKTNEVVQKGALTIIQARAKASRKPGYKT